MRKMTITIDPLVPGPRRVRATMGQVTGIVLGLRTASFDCSKPINGQAIMFVHARIGQCALSGRPMIETVILVNPVGFPDRIESDVIVGPQVDFALVKESFAMVEV